MESPTRRRARAFVVTGFAMVALGSVITFIRTLTTAGYFAHAGALSDFESVVSPLIGLVAVWSWWWLSKIRVADPHQMSFVRKGLYGLATQNLLICALALATLFDLPVFNRNSWDVAPLWAHFWGTLAISIGFTLLARQTSREGAVVSEPSDNAVGASVAQ